MSGQSKNSRRSLSPDRPFDVATLKRAGEIAAGYKILAWFEEGQSHGKGLEILAMAGGKTPEQCIPNVRKALTTAVAVMLEQGQVPPWPAASSRAHRGLSDFVRCAAIAASHGELTDV